MYNGDLVDEAKSGIWMVAFCAAVAAACVVNDDTVVVVVSSEIGLAAEGVEGVVENGIAKVWDMCAEMDDRI